MRLILFSVAVLAALAAAYLATRAARLSDPAAALEEVLIASRPIAAGEELGALRLAWAPWPKTAVGSGFILRAQAPEGLADYAAQVALAPLVKGEPVYREKIARPEGGVLATMLGKSYRAVTIAVNDVGGVGGFALPKDRVDVIFVPHDTRGAAASGRVVVRDVRVLAVNQVIAAAGASLGSSVRTATLEVTEGQARELLQAATQGTLALSLRPLGALEPPPPPPEPPPPPVPVLETPAPAEPPEKVVSVYRGLTKEAVRLTK